MSVVLDTDFLQAFKELWLPMGSLILTTGVGYYTGRMRVLAQEALAHEQREKNRAAARKDEQLQLRQENAAQLEAQNRRMELLNDGYENRIKDLTEEVHGLREEVKSLRQALDQRPKQDCEHCERRKILEGHIANLQKGQQLMRFDETAPGMA